MTTTSHITEKRKMLAAADRLLEEAEIEAMYVEQGRYSDRHQRNLSACLSQYDSLIATIAQTPLSPSVPGMKVYSMMEERL